MLIFLGKKILPLFPVLWGVASLVFLFIHLIPGDPVEIMLGESALPANKAALREKLHLNDPLWKQYMQFWRSVTVLDLGESIVTKKKVSQLIADRYGNTLALAFCSLLLAISISIPLGVYAAVRKNSIIDHFISTLSLTGISMPSFWFGTLLMLFFSVKLGWLPVSAKESWRSFVLPSCTLGISLTAILTRITRNNLLEVLSQDYIITARSKGISETSVLFKHALKNALIPIITIIGLHLGSLLAGAVITETIFDWPGLGELLYRAIQSRDYPIVQACVLVIASSYVLANTLADMAYSIANPKLKME